MEDRQTEWITFLTDYGLENKFTGVCRGVIARIAPHARLIDITHLVPRGDVRHGAIVLRQAVRYLPPKAVHLAVVDPGVGTKRRAICVSVGSSVLVGPDNGLLVWAADELGGGDAAYEITNLADYALTPMSSSFHGRDLFSPIAAHIATGVELSDLGPAVDVDSLVRLPKPLLAVDADSIAAEVLIVDRFGNLQTSIDEDALQALGVGKGAMLEVSSGQSWRTAPFTDTFADVPEGALLAHLDSAGLLAVAVNLGSAAENLAVDAGARLTIRRA